MWVRVHARARLHLRLYLCYSKYCPSLSGAVLKTKVRYGNLQPEKLPRKMNLNILFFFSLRPITQGCHSLSQIHTHTYTFLFQKPSNLMSTGSV